MAELTVFCICSCVLSCCPSIRCAGILIKPEHMHGGNPFHGGILVDRCCICRNKSLPKSGRHRP